MQHEVQYLLEIVKYLLNNKTIEVPHPHPDMDWKALYKLAERHSIINLVFYGEEYLPEELRPSEADRDYLYKCASRDMIRSYRQTDAAEEILDAFEKAGINVLAVKGVRTKRHYPEPDMRTMGDVDILYQTTKDSRVKQIMEELGYESKMEGRVHDMYTKKPYVGIEMHRQLVASDSEYCPYYESIWDKVKTRENCKYIHEMSVEQEYIYTITHLAEHFRHGGIGIRFLMDIYVYDCKGNMDWDYIETELKQLGLWAFYKNVSDLAKRWFGVNTITVPGKSVIDRLEEYILVGGTFGTNEYAAAISVAKEGKYRFIWKAMFPNLKNMQSMFPWIKKWPILLPYSWMLRGARSIFFRRDHIKGQFNRYKHGNEKLGNELRDFFETCGL